MSAIVYLRYSPRPAKSLEGEDPNVKQWRLILADCERREVSIRGTFADAAKSGSDRKRPALAEAIKALKRGDELVVFKWDRLARDLFKLLSIAEDVRDKKCTLYSVSEGLFFDDKDIMRFAMSAIAGLFAQIQRKEIGERSSRVARRKQAEGIRVSNIPPYGKRIDPFDSKRLVDDPEQQAIIREIETLYVTGMGPRAIARELNRRKIRCRDCQDFMGWGPTLVASILKREGARNACKENSTGL